VAWNSLASETPEDYPSGAARGIDGRNRPRRLSYL